MNTVYFQRTYSEMVFEDQYSAEWGNIILICLNNKITGIPAIKSSSEYFEKYSFKKEVVRRIYSLIDNKKWG